MYGRIKNLSILEPYGFYNKNTREYDIDKIIKVYRMFYNYNLKEALKFFQCKWIEPLDIKVVEKHWKWDSEKEKEIMMEELMNTGYFNPIIVFENPFEGHYEVYVGNHRTDAIHTLIKQGKWNEEKKIMVFVVPKFLKASRKKLEMKRDHFDNHIKLPQPGKMYFLNYLKRERFYYIDIKEEMDIGNGISLITLDKYLPYYKLLTSTSDAMKSIMYQYKLDKGYLMKEVLEMSRFMNDYGEWEKWIKGEGKYDFKECFTN